MLVLRQMTGAPGPAHLDREDGGSSSLPSPDEMQKLQKLQGSLSFLPCHLDAGKSHAEGWDLWG